MNRIAELRKERHLNQIGLAMKLNISQYMVSAYETERHHPTSDMLIAMSDFFDVSIDYLLCRSNVKSCADKILKEADEREPYDRHIQRASAGQAGAGDRDSFCPEKL